MEEGRRLLLFPRICPFLALRPLNEWYGPLRGRGGEERRESERDSEDATVAVEPS
jgi:hypothetical protein